jgi:hypothetical protein
MWGYMWYGAGMRYPTTHRFLKWLAPTIGATATVSTSLLFAAAQVWQGAKEWAGDCFAYLIPVMTAPWFIATAIFAIGAYIWALIYCGVPAPPRPIDEDAEYERRATERRIEQRLRRDQTRENDAALIGLWNSFVAERNRQIENRKKDE